MTLDRSVPKLTVEEEVALLEPFAGDDVVLLKDTDRSGNIDKCSWCNLDLSDAYDEGHERGCKITALRNRLADLGFPMRRWKVDFTHIHRYYPESVMHASAWIHSCRELSTEQALHLAQHELDTWGVGRAWNGEPDYVGNHRYVDPDSIKLYVLRTFYRTEEGD